MKTKRDSIRVAAIQAVPVFPLDAQKTTRMPARFMIRKELYMPILILNKY